jgi:hypothetical protein
MGGCAHHTAPSVRGGPLDVRTFGARGDGSGDDAPALRAAVAAAGPDGAVYLPTGVYRLATDVVIARDHLSLFGDGRSSVIYWPGGAHQPPYRQVIQLYGSDLEVRDLRFRGDNGDEGGRGFVHASGSQKDMLSSAIAIGGGSRATPNHDITVRHCWFENLFGFSIQNGNGTPSSHLRRFSALDNVMTHDGNGLNVSALLSIQARNVLSDAEGIETLGYQSVIADNIIHGAWNGGISVYGDNVVVKGNVVDMTDVRAGSSGGRNAFVAITAAGVHGGIIEGNTVVDPGSHAIAVIPDNTPSVGRRSQAVTISGNTVLSRRDSGAGNDLTEVVYLAEVRDVAVVGNVLHGAAGPGFSTTIGVGVFASSGVTVVDNLIRGCAMAGIDVERGSSDVILSQNNVVGGRFGLVVQKGSRRVSMLNNHLAEASEADLRVDPGASGVRLLGNVGERASIAAEAVRFQAGNSWQESP